MTPAERFQFGPFEIRMSTGEVTKSGRLLRLPPQPSRVLALLVRRAPETVTREEIQAEIWSDGTVVEFDQGLNFCIRQIRSALGEDAKEPQFIETIPKRGYRFVAPVTPILPEGEAQPEPISAPPRWRWLWPAAVVASLLLAAGIWLATRPRLPGTPEADRAFMEAEHLAGTGVPENRPKAAELYEKVTQLTPRFAPAWAGWSNIDVMMVFAQQGKGAVLLKASEEHARKALALDDSSALAHAVLAHSYWHAWKWREAEAEFRRAISLDAKEPIAQHLFALFLAATGHKAEALMRARQALELAPTSGIVNYTLAMVNLQTGEYETAITEAKNTLVISHHYPAAFIVQMRAHALLGRGDQAMAAHDEAVNLGDRDAYGLYRARLLAQTGYKTEARTIVDNFHPAPNLRRAPSELVTTLAALGDIDAAFAALNIAVDDHIPALIWIKSDPEYAPMRSDPRFREVLARLGNP